MNLRERIPAKMKENILFSSIVLLLDNDFKTKAVEEKVGKLVDILNGIKELKLKEKLSKIEIEGYLNYRKAKLQIIG